MDPFPTDGRTARRDRNREAVLDAVLELFGEGRLTPSPAEVAERSGVSLRSVYRYVSDGDELVRAAIARNWERTRPAFESGDIGSTGPRRDRIEALAAARLRLHTAAAPTARAAIAASPSEPIIAQRLDGLQRGLAAQVDAAFRPELAAMDRSMRREVRAALDLLFGFESVEHLRRRCGLSAAAARRTIVRSATALLDATVGPEADAGPSDQAQPPA